MAGPGLLGAPWLGEPVPVGRTRFVVPVFDRSVNRWERFVYVLVDESGEPAGRLDLGRLGEAVADALAEHQAAQPAQEGAAAGELALDPRVGTVTL